MSIGDFVSKTASEALGRIIAQAPKQFMAFATSAIICKKEVSAFLGRLLLAHLTEVGTLIYGEPVRYTFGASETYIERLKCDSDFVVTDQDDDLSIVLRAETQKAGAK